MEQHRRPSHTLIPGRQLEESDKFIQFPESQTAAEINPKIAGVTRKNFIRSLTREQHGHPVLSRQTHQAEVSHHRRIGKWFLLVPKYFWQLIPKIPTCWEIFVEQQIRMHRSEGIHSLSFRFRGIVAGDEHMEFLA